MARPAGTNWMPIATRPEKATMWGMAIPKTTGRSPRRGTTRLPWADSSASSTTLATALRKAAVHNGEMLWTNDLVTGQLEPQARTTTANNSSARCLGR